MKQYGFYFDSDRCTGCKTCELACKDYKDLGTDVIVGFMSIQGELGISNRMAVGIKMYLPITSLSLVTIVRIPRVLQFVQREQCTKMKMVLLS